ncbi:MAG: long-chain fatty acid--CoA ligase, partial [Myxococcota bacterium]
MSGPADLTNLLASGLADRPGQPALISGRRVRTWEQLEQDIATLAAGLTALGLQQGDRVASLVPNRGELLLHYLACLRAGLVVAPLNYRYTPAEIDHALDVSQSSVLVAHAERADDVRASALASRLTLGVVSVGGALDDARRFEDLLSSDEPTVDLPTPDFGAAAFVFFTSGSTGKPKGVTHSLSSFGCIASGWAESMALTVDDVVLPGSSIAHVGSLATSLAALSAGATVIVPHSLDPADLLLLLREHRPTHLLTTSASLISLGRLDDAAPDDFASLRLCMSGGDTFPPNLAREFADRTGAVVHQTYGLTEATSCMFNASATKVGSPGVLCPGYAASLRDERGQEVAVDVEANLWVSGDPVMVGYWRDPHATAASIVDGWFDTGDVMRVDAEGYFWFC